MFEKNWKLFYSMPNFDWEDANEPFLDYEKNFFGTLDELQDYIAELEENGAFDILYV